MARANRPGADHVYSAAQRIVDAGLRADGTIFTPAASVWSREAFEMLSRTLAVRADATEGERFLDKLHQEIGNADPVAIRLMAELLYVHFLITIKIGGDKKRQVIRTVLGWAGEHVDIPRELAEALDYGLVNPGTWYNTRREAQLTFLVRFGLAWKRLSAAEQERSLADPWQFKATVMSVDAGSAYSQQWALLHLIHPDTFEAITSREHKQRILDTFAEHVTVPTEDADRRILQIREGLASQYGPQLDFYGKELKSIWREPPQAWDELIAWAKRFAELPRFEDDERNYKLRVQMAFQSARAALFSGSEDWPTQLNRAFKQKENNLTSWQAHDKFLRWVDGNLDTAAAALRELWADGKVDSKRIRTFLANVPASELPGTGARLSIASLLLMTVDPINWPVFRPEPFKKGYALTGTPAPPRNSDEAELYDHALAFLDRFIRESASRDFEVKDRLEAQGLVWALIKWPAPESWSAQDREEFLAFRGDEPGAETIAPPESAGRVQERPTAIGGATPVPPRLLVNKSDAAGVRSAARYWCIAPGEGARLWPDFQEAGVIAMGPDELGDFSAYESKARMAEALKAARAGDREPMNDALACWQFAHDIQVGDVVLAKRGTGEIVGYGVVTGDYEHHPERAEYRNTRRASWIATGNWKLPEELRIAVKTLTDVSAHRSLLNYILPLVTANGAPEVDLDDAPPFSVTEALDGLFMEPPRRSRTFWTPWRASETS
ncbi:MAG: hypothetical protein ACR2NS_14985 [Gemmatimonadaceae bacterium]